MFVTREKRHGAVRAIPDENRVVIFRYLKDLTYDVVTILCGSRVVNKARQVTNIRESLTDILKFYLRSSIIKYLRVTSTQYDHYCLHTTAECRGRFNVISECARIARSFETIKSLSCVSPGSSW